MDKPSDVLDELFRKDPNIKHLLSPSQDELRGLDEAISRLGGEYDRDPQKSDTAFEYASLMISHSRRSYIERGLSIMELLGYGAWRRHWDTLAFTELHDAVKMAGGETLGHSGVVQGEVGVAASAPPEMPVEYDYRNTKVDVPVSDLAICYYYLAIGWIKLQKYDRAKASVNHMLQLEPEHRQGVALKQFIDAEVRQVRVTTGLAGAGVVAAVAAVASLLLRRS